MKSVRLRGVSTCWAGRLKFMIVPLRLSNGAMSPLPFATVNWFRIAAAVLKVKLLRVAEATPTVPKPVEMIGVADAVCVDKNKPQPSTPTVAKTLEKFFI